MRFKPQVNIPGATIIESGSVGRKLYFIKSGHCVVVPVTKRAKFTAKRRDQGDEGNVLKFMRNKSMYMSRRSRGRCVVLRHVTPFCLLPLGALTNLTFIMQCNVISHSLCNAT
jgi:hypothetical protein